MIKLKIYCPTLLLFLAVNLYAGYDTLEITHRYAIYLVFDHPIEWVDLGQGDQYHFKIEGNCLFIKATRAEVNPSTLLVKQGNAFYQAWLHYAPTPVRWFHTMEKSKLMEGTPNYPSDSSYFKDILQKLLKNQKPTTILSKRRQTVQCQLTQLAVDDQVIYLVFELENQSSLDFNIDFISFEWIQFHSRGWFKKKKKSVKYSKVLTYEHPDMIPASSKGQLGFVIPVFAAERNGKLVVTFREKNGDRIVSMNIKSKHFHQAMRIKS